MADFSQFFAVSHDLTATLEKALTRVARGVQAGAGILLLRDEANGAFVCRATVGPLDLNGARVETDRGLIGRCLRHNAVEIADGPRTEPDLLPLTGAHGSFLARNAMCAPLAVDGRTFGVIQVMNKQHGSRFDRRDAFLVQAMANAAALAVANARLTEELVRREITERELDLAAEIQRNLLPKPDGDSLPVYGLNRPIRQVSGDFFDYFALADGQIAFALGDVAGKGINAALLMAKAASLFRCLGKRIGDPAAILTILNREIHETVSRGMFVTMVGGTYDPPSGRLRFANAGHQPPLLRRAGHNYRTFPAEAPPLGILPDITFWNHETYLDDGELYIFSDGLIDFHYGTDEDLGVEGLIQLVEGLADLPLGNRLQALLAALDREGWEVRDDLTVLAIDGARRSGHV